jgi:hypothetical protein
MTKSLTVDAKKTESLAVALKEAIARQPNKEAAGWLNQVGTRPSTSQPSRQTRGAGQSPVITCTIHAARNPRAPYPHIRRF